MFTYAPATLDQLTSRFVRDAKFLPTTDPDRAVTDITRSLLAEYHKECYEDPEWVEHFELASRQILEDLERALFLKWRTYRERVRKFDRLFIKRLSLNVATGPVLDSDNWPKFVAHRVYLGRDYTTAGVSGAEAAPALPMEHSVFTVPEQRSSCRLERGVIDEDGTSSTGIWDAEEIVETTTALAAENQDLQDTGGFFLGIVDNPYNPNQSDPTPRIREAFPVRRADSDTTGHFRPERTSRGSARRAHPYENPSTPTGPHQASSSHLEDRRPHFRTTSQTQSSYIPAMYPPLVGYQDYTAAQQRFFAPSSLCYPSEAAAGFSPTGYTVLQRQSSEYTTQQAIQSQTNLDAVNHFPWSSEAGPDDTEDIYLSHR